MTAPIRPDDEFAKWKAEQEFAAWKAQQAPAVRENPATNRPTEVDQLRRAGSMMQNFADNASFGGVGIVDDALSAMATSAPGMMRGEFARRRAERKANRNALTGVERGVSAVSGALVNPVGTIVRAPQGAGLLMRGLAGAGDAIVQGGAMAAGTNLDAATPEGLIRAGKAGLMGGAAGVIGAGMAAGGMGVVRGANFLRRAIVAPTLDRAYFGLQDAMRGADDLFFGQVAQEAKNVSTSRGIRAALRSPTMVDYVNRVRANPAYKGLNDSEVFLEAYKGMSSAQRAALGKVEGAPDLQHAAKMQVDAIGAAKKEARPLAAPALPTFNTANTVHATNRSAISAFEETRDAVSRILNNRSQKGGKIKFESPEALRRGIADMTPVEAEAALTALRGSTKEAWKLSTNILSGFGVPGAIARTAMAPHRIREFASLLEERAGKTAHGLFENPVVRQRMRGTAAIAAGGLLDQ